MTANNAAAKVTESGEAAFFLGTLNDEADMIYRFSFAVTLNVSSAENLLKEAYRRLLSDLSRFVNEDHLTLRFHLLHTVWGLFCESDMFASGEALKTEIFGELTAEYRAALTLVDGLGVTVKEAQQIMGVENQVLRQWLSVSRRVMIENGTTKG